MRNGRDGTGDQGSYIESQLQKTNTTELSKKHIWPWVVSGETV